MKILVFFIAVAQLLLPAAAHCDDGNPVILGFDFTSPFTRPPNFDSCVASFPFPTCSAVDYDTDEEIKYKTFDSEGTEVTRTLKIADFYGGEGEAKTFTDLCEELWILNDFVAQASFDGSNFSYESRGLCFDKGITFGPTSPNGFDSDLDSSRSEFIIETCHGKNPCDETGSEYCSDPENPLNPDLAEDRLARLSDEVETLALYAEDQARRLEFDLSSQSALASQLKQAEDLYELQSDKEAICGLVDATCNDKAVLCNDLQDCFKRIFADLFKGDNEDVDVDEIFDDQFMYEQCFNTTNAELMDTKDGVCADTAPSCSSYDIGQGFGVCGESPGGNPTEPLCPDRVKGYFDSFDPAYPDPAVNPSYDVAIFFIEELYLCKSESEINFQDRTSADVVGITLIVKIALEGAKIVAEVFKDSLPHWEPYIFKIFPFQILAVALNLVDNVYGLAGYHDGLIDGAEVEAIYENTLTLLNGSASIYDEVVCRCTELKTLRGQGCDSVDNDCNDEVDECGEDNFAPEIDISDASLNCASGNGQTKWFTSNDTALGCVSTYSSVVDDCDTTILMDDLTLTSTCDSAEILLEASDRCNNAAESKIVPVFIDLQAPTVSCGLGPNDNPVLYVQDTGAGVMTDVNLSYQATDNCGFPLDVKVDVYANEIEDFHNQETAIFFRNGTPNNKVGMYVAAQYCVTDANGQCVKDPVLDTRVYTVVVSTADEAGNVAVPAECRVVILPVGTTASDFPTLDETKQRFLLSSYSSNFTDYMEVSEIILS